MLPYGKVPQFRSRIWRAGAAKFVPALDARSVSGRRVGCCLYLGYRVSSQWLYPFILKAGSLDANLPPKVVDINTLLLSPGEINSIMGTADIVIKQTGQAPDDTADVSPIECHAEGYIAGTTEYSGNGLIAMRWQVLDNANGSVVQAVAQFPSSDAANKFIETWTPSWEACRGKAITEKDKATGREFGPPYIVTDVTAANHMITAVDARNGVATCQHVLKAASNFVLDISACRDNISDQGQTITAKISAKID